jgi:hypothetical protein
VKISALSRSLRSSMYGAASPGRSSIGTAFQDVATSIATWRAGPQFIRSMPAAPRIYFCRFSN